MMDVSRDIADFTRRAEIAYAAMRKAKGQLAKFCRDDESLASAVAAIVVTRAPISAAGCLPLAVGIRATAGALSQDVNLTQCAANRSAVMTATAVTLPAMCGASLPGALRPTAGVLASAKVLLSTAAMVCLCRLDRAEHSRESENRCAAGDQYRLRNCGHDSISILLIVQNPKPPVQAWSGVR